MTKGKKTALIISAIGLVTISSLSAGIFFAIKSLTGSSKPNTNIQSNVVDFQAVEHKTLEITEAGGVDIYEYRGDYQILNKDLTPIVNGRVNYLLDNEGLALLAQKIRTRLTFGPESSMLKGIYLRGDLGTFANDANGVFFGATHQIFINMNNILRTYHSFRWTPSDGKIIDYEIMTEIIFQIIFHEYHHFIADVYLNSYAASDNRAQLVYEKNKTSIVNGITNFLPSNSEPWDKDFYNTFVNSLGYNNEDKTNSTESYDYNGKQIRPLSNILSLKDLFYRVNVSDTSINFSELTATTNVSYRPFTSNPAITLKLAPYVDSDLMYYYDIDELFVRKMQQAFMPLTAEVEYGFQNFAETTPQGALTGFFRSNYNNNRYFISPFLYDTLSYAGSAIDPNPFYKDYLFQAADSQNSIVANNDNARTLYQSLTTVMGYQDKADISMMWWKNESGIDANGGAYLAPRTDLMKFGGYICDCDKGKKFVGYFDPITNAFTGFPITVSEFNYKLKEKINSTSFLPLDATKDNYFYTLDDFVDVNLVKDKDLYFADDAAGTNPIKLASSNSKASTFYAQVGSQQNSQIAYTTVVNGAAHIKLT